MSILRPLDLYNLPDLFHHFKYTFADAQEKRGILIPVMERLLEHISSLRGTDVPASELFRTFSDRIRHRFRACASAMICTEGLALNEHQGETVQNDDQTLLVIQAQ